MANKFVGDNAFSGKGWFSSLLIGAGWFDQELIDVSGGAVVTGTGTATLPALTDAASAAHGVLGNAAGTLSQITAAGAAIHGVSGVEAGALPAITAAGVANDGSVTGAASATLPAIEASGLAESEQPPVISGGQVRARVIRRVIPKPRTHVLGYAVGVLPALSARAAATHAVSANGYAVLPTLLGAAVAAQGVSGAGAGVLGPIRASGRVKHDWISDDDVLLLLAA